jgi:hypothetical protein
MTAPEQPTPQCRFCGELLSRTFADLGSMPLANSYLASIEDADREQAYPLHARVCGACRLVQVDDAVPPGAIFSDYAYFSSNSRTWVDHARAFSEMARRRFALTPQSQVVEVASNDGYLLQHFVAADIPVLGVEPAANVAAAAEAAGVATRVAFFGRELAQQLRGEGFSADLLLGNNVLAHVPDLNGFAAGLALLLKDDGVLTMEFPHLLRLIEDVQFDTIYHEHFSYFSLLTVDRVFARHGLRLFDVEELPTHGGSLRIFACREESTQRPTGAGLATVRDAESRAGLDGDDVYSRFQDRAGAVRDALRTFLAGVRNDGKRLAAYGAAAKGNTLLNYCGIDAGDIPYVVDVSPHKQGRYLPGSHIPIRPVEYLREDRPDYVLILPWNLRNEIITDHGYIRDWGGRFVVAVPQIEIGP